MKNLFDQEPFLVRLLSLIGSIIGEIATIIIGFFLIILKLLKRLRRAEWRLIVMGFIFYSAYTAILPNVYAPKSAHAMDGQIPMVIHTDLSVKQIVLSMTKFEFGESEIQAMDNLLTHESGFDPRAINPNSGACGLFQSLPCGKMLSMSLQDQIQFGFDYIKTRYGTPSKAWAFWQTKHLVDGKWVNYY